jgi:hypothetical protein
MLGRNLANFVLHIAKEGDINLDGDDPIMQGTLVARDGKVVNERVAGLLDAPAPGSSSKASS